MPFFIIKKAHTGTKDILRYDNVFLWLDINKGSIKILLPKSPKHPKSPNKMVIRDLLHY